MPIDGSRYGFIIEEYRYNSASNIAIATNFNKARRMDIETNLDDSPAAQALCNAMYAVIGQPRRRFSITTAGTEGVSINDFANGMKGATLKAAELSINNLPVIVTRIIIDEDDDQVISEVWG